MARARHACAVLKRRALSRSPNGCHTESHIRCLLTPLTSGRVHFHRGIVFDFARIPGLDSNQRKPASRFLLHVPGAAAGFEAPCPGTLPGGPVTQPAGLLRREGGQDRLQPIREEPPGRQAEADLQPAASDRTAPAGGQHSRHRDTVRHWGGNRHPNAAGAFQRPVESRAKSRLGSESRRLWNGRVRSGLRFHFQAAWFLAVWQILERTMGESVERNKPGLWRDAWLAPPHSSSGRGAGWGARITLYERTVAGVGQGHSVVDS